MRAPGCSPNIGKSSQKPLHLCSRQNSEKGMKQASAKLEDQVLLTHLQTQYTDSMHRAVFTFRPPTRPSAVSA